MGGSQTRTPSFCCQIELSPIERADQALSRAMRIGRKAAACCHGSARSCPVTTTASVIRRLLSGQQRVILGRRMGQNRGMAVRIPAVLAANCRKTEERTAWLEGLPEALRILERRWSLTVRPPFENASGSCAWVAPVMRADGTSAVLKLAMPHFEGEDEIQGLRFWNGEPTIRLLEADDELGGMLLERCQPGTALGELAEPEQDVIISALLQRLWRTPSGSCLFRPLSAMLEHWSAETLAEVKKWPDAGLVREGLLLFEDLSRTAPVDVLLATDLHAGNVLRSEREPWLVIDPKPFIGDPAYDVTQHLFNCERLLTDPEKTINRVADLLCLDRRRVQLWTFARAAAEPRDHWSGSLITLARAIAPA